jgi:hypothetical protein
VSRSFPRVRRLGAALLAAPLLGAVAAAGLAGASAPLAPAARAQSSGQSTAQAPSEGVALSVTTLQQEMARGDAALAAGNLSLARRHYDTTRDGARRLIGFYRDLSGAFRGIDARIPREMDEKGERSVDLLVQASMRLANLFRRQGQGEVAVPLLIEVIKLKNPATHDIGRRAYQQLIDIGFATTPYKAPGSGEF